MTHRNGILTVHNFVLLAALSLISSVSTAQHITEIHAITDPGSYSSPQFGIDESILAFTSAGYDDLWILKNGVLKKIVDSESSGYGFLWSPNGEKLIYRTNSNQIYQIFQTDLDGTSFPLGPPDKFISLPGYSGQVLVTRTNLAEAPTILIESTEHRRPVTYADTDSDVINVWVDLKKTPVSNPNEACFAPIISPDRNRILYQSLTTGIHVCDLDGSNNIALGPGSDPAWSPDSNYIVFSITSDDGHRITSSDLYIGLSKKPCTPLQLTQTATRIERHPSVSHTGKKIAFDADGIIFTGNLEIEQIERYFEKEVSR